MNHSGAKSGQITAHLYTDPTCPFDYSAGPALRTIEWRYRDQIDWQMVMIGLSEPGDPPKYEPGWLASHLTEFKNRYGMPFASEPKIRTATSSRACQAIIAARLLQPGFEWRVHRTLQLLFFNTPLLIDDESQLEAALSSVDGLAHKGVMEALDTPEVQDAYQRDRAETRTAAGGPTEFQGRAAGSGDETRYTAPSVVFSRGDTRLEAGGFQPVEAYDVIIANLGTDLNRSDPPEDPLEALSFYPGGLSTQELAAIMTDRNGSADRAGTERKLVELQSEQKVKRIPMGNDAIWLFA